MKVVLIMFKDGQDRQFPLTAKTTTLGRRQDCGLRIPTGDVSRQHCDITLTDKGVIVRDLGSSNGTFVNGKRIAETELRPGDRLSVGPITFVVQIDGRPAEVKPPPSGAALPGGAELSADDVPTAIEEVLDLDDSDIELDDPISALEGLTEEDEEEDEDGPATGKGKP